MEKEEALKKLLKEIHKKPRGLDDKIIQKIQKIQEISQEETVKQQVPYPSWNWVYVLLGLFFIGGLAYSFTIVKFNSNWTVWIMFLAILIPLLADGIWQYKQIKVENEY